MTTKITPEQALASLDDLDDYAKMGVSVIPTGAVETVLKFILEHSTADNFKDEDSVRNLQYLLMEYVDAPYIIENNLTKSCGYDMSEFGKDE
jgi:hypothetical protein